MAPRFPRLLIATEFAPNASGGGPAVVRQFLSGWPTQNLFWWSCWPERGQRFGQQVASHFVAAFPAKLYPGPRCARLRSWLMERFWSPGAARHLRHTLRSVKPDVTWVIPHAWSIPPLAKILSQGQFRFHTSIHDYVDTSTHVARLGPARAARMADWADRLYAQANSRDAISRPMADDLLRRTGQASSQILHAGLEPGDFQYLTGKTTSAARELRIAYAGTILVEREFALFVEVLRSLRKLLFAPLSIDFFGSHSYRSRPWFAPSWMREHGELAEPALATALKQCTWGFSPVSLTDQDPRYNRFSLPTKFVSYLAAGLPIITLGHEQSSLIEIAKTYRVGPALTRNDPEWIHREILASLSDKNPWTTFKSEILRCAQTEFDAAHMRKVLHECLSAGGPAQSLSRQRVNGTRTQPL